MKNPEKIKDQVSGNLHERTSGFVIPPATESLLYINKADSLWSPEIANNAKLQEQAALRRNIFLQLEVMFKKIQEAETDIRNAIDGHAIESEELTALYNALSKFLEEGEENSRMVLYLPFELLPESDWQPNSDALAQAIEKFSIIYLEKWNNLLKIHDVRANFIDGDIPENQERSTKVSKAAHFIPVLVQKKLIQVEDIIKKIETTHDEVLRQSIADTIPVLADLNLLKKDDLERMTTSNDSLVKNMAIIIKSNKQHDLEKTKNADTSIHDKTWLNQLPQELGEEIIELRNANKKPSETKARIIWETERNIEKKIDAYSNDIAFSLEAGSINFEDIAIFIKSNIDDTDALVAGIYGIQKAVEIATKNLIQAKEIQSKFDSEFKILWDKKNPKIQDALLSVWSKWVQIGVIAENYIEKFGIKLPTFDEQFNIEKNPITHELIEIHQIMKSIESHELAKYIYRVAIVYGSKVKGYGTQTTDTDIALFVKPEVSIEQEAYIRSLVDETIKNINKVGNPLLFWIKENQDNLEIQNVKNEDPHTGNASFAHVLFGGVWCGDHATIKELYAKLLSGYLYSKGKKMYGENAQQVWLEQIERDILQYRLMHKGYMRFHKAQGGFHTPHSDSIDSESTFWDSGYRRLATKLFISKVFLPQLEK